MRFFVRVVTLASIALSIGVAGAAQSGRPNFESLDGVPLGVKESVAIAALGNFPPSPSPSPYVGPSPYYVKPACLPPNNPHCAEIIRSIEESNRVSARMAAEQQAYQRTVTPRPVTSAEAFEEAFHPHVKACFSPTGSNGARTYDTFLYGVDRKRSVRVSLTEMSPASPCETLVTAIQTDQTVSGSTLDEVHAVEDEFVKAAIAKFGKPTYFRARHLGTVVDSHLLDNGLSALTGTIVGGGSVPTQSTVEKRVLPPYAAWCDGGTVADCQRDGPTVRRVLSLSINELNETPGVSIDLIDLSALRRAKAAFLGANVRSAAPQL